jgi:uncharacterized small protein (DUF1192 family)
MKLPDLAFAEISPEVIRGATDAKLEQLRNYAANLADDYREKLKTARKNQAPLTLSLLSVEDMHQALMEEILRRRAEREARRAPQPNGSN